MGAAAVRLLLGVVLAATAVAREEPVGVRLEPGREITVSVLAAGTPMRVFVPQGDGPESGWPILFYYHGTGGWPGTELIRRYAGDTDFVVVGMPYADEMARRESEAELRAYIQREWANHREAMTWVQRQVSINPQRVILSGLSKGGWTVSAMAELAPAETTGVAILLAGRPRQGLPERLARGLADKPVYIGAGQTDQNLPAAREATQIYRKAGAQVTSEVYAGIGHQAPASAQKLTHWFDAMGHWRSVPLSEAKPALLEQFRAAFLALEDETDPMRRYQRTRDIVEDPRLQICGNGALRSAEAQLAQLRRASPIKEEWIAEQGFTQLVWKHARIKRLGDLKSVRDGFQWLVDSYPQTYHGRLAVDYLASVSSAYDRSVAATRRATPATPAPPATTGTTPAFPDAGGRRGFPVPKRSGNTVSFQ